MNRSRSPPRGSSRRHSDRSPSPHRSRKHDAVSRRSRSPQRDRLSDRRRSPSPRSSRRSSDGRSSRRSDSSDESRERRRGGRRSDEKPSRRHSSPARSGRSGHDDRRPGASESRLSERPSGDSGRPRQSRWESEPVPAPPPVAAPAPAPPPRMHAAAVVPPPPPPPPPSEKQSQSSAAALAPDASDAPRVPAMFTPVPLQPAQPAMFTPVPLQPAQMTRIYVGNVYRELSEAEIQTVFEAFGPVRSCKFIPNPENGVGKHKGFGFIEYVDPAAAASAVQAMNGFTLAGRAVKVGWAHSASTAASSSVDLQQVAAMFAPSQQPLNRIFELNTILQSGGGGGSACQQAEQPVRGLQSCTVCHRRNTFRVSSVSGKPAMPSSSNTASSHTSPPLPHVFCPPGAHRAAGCRVARHVVT